MSRKLTITAHKLVKLHLRLPLELVQKLDQLAEERGRIHGLRGGRREVLRQILYETLSIKKYRGPQARLQELRTKPLARYMRKHLYLRPIEDRICLLILKGYGWSTVCTALNQEGWPPPGGGKEWRKQQAKNTLRMALYDVTRHRSSLTPFFGEPEDLELLDFG